MTVRNNSGRKWRVEPPTNRPDLSFIFEDAAVGEQGELLRAFLVGDPGPRYPLIRDILRHQARLLQPLPVFGMPHTIGAIARIRWAYCIRCPGRVQFPFEIEGDPTPGVLFALANRSRRTLSQILASSRAPLGP